MAIEIGALAAKVALGLGWDKAHAAARLSALAMHLAETEGVKIERALEQLATQAVRDLCCLVAEGVADQAKALMLPHDLPAQKAPSALGVSASRASGDGADEQSEALPSS